VNFSEAKALSGIIFFKFYGPFCEITDYGLIIESTMAFL
jgi:hypothetical protein